MNTKVISCFGAVSMLALAACSHDRQPPNTPASDTMESEVDARGGPTPTHGSGQPLRPPASLIFTEPPGAPPQKVP